MDLGFSCRSGAHRGWITSYNACAMARALFLQVCVSAVAACQLSTLTLNRALLSRTTRLHIFPLGASPHAALSPRCTAGSSTYAPDDVPMSNPVRCRCTVVTSRSRWTDKASAEPVKVHSQPLLPSRFVSELFGGRFSTRLATSSQL